MLNKRQLPKFTKLQLRQGINNNTALSLKLQTSPILAQGTRISRKCQHIKDFISNFSAYINAWLSEHNSTLHYRVIYRNIRRALTRACNEHSQTWAYHEEALWTRLCHKLLSQQTHCSPQQKHRIRLLINMRTLQPYSPPTVIENQRKRRLPLEHQNQLTPPTKRRHHHTYTTLPTSTLPTHSHHTPTAGPISQLPRPDAAVPDPADFSYLEDDEEDQKLPIPPNQHQVTKARADSSPITHQRYGIHPYEQ